MLKLVIRAPYETRTVVLDGDVSIGRADAASVVIDDPGLSRKNTTFFRDGEDCLGVDENSTNGTLLNGERISGAPSIIRAGDEVRLGNGTVIRVETAGIETAKPEPAVNQAATPQTSVPKPASKKPPAKSQSKTVLYLATAMSVMIVNNTPIELQNTLNFTWQQNNIQIKLGFLSFNNQNILTRYRLTPNDPWTRSANWTFAFNSLAPGQ